MIRSTEAFGLVSPLAPYPATLLGASGVTPLELTVAFGTLVNGGKRVTPYLIARVESQDGRVVYEAAHSATPALEASSAFLARRALEGVTAEGTGWRVRREGVRDVVVGKTGTSNDANDLWFVGSTPDVTATVWISFDHPTPVLNGRATAASVAAPLWGKVVSAYEEQVSAESRWEPAPHGLRLVDLDAQTCLRVTEACPATGEVGRERFLPGTEPEDNCAPRPLPIGTVELGPWACAPPSIARLDSR